MKNYKFIFFVIFTAIIIFIFIDKTNKNGFLESSTISMQKTINNDLQQDNFDFLPTSTTNQIVYNDFYTLSYNEQFEQSEWVAYKLLIKNDNTHFNRPFFIEDPKVKTHSADWKNYRNSGFDKGHLCPAADMKFSKTAFDATFYTSNISPQINEFNDGIWNRLEEKVRFWSTKYNGLYVITGGVLTKELKTIGYEKVAVPNYFYKILLDSNKSRMIAFLVPHNKSDKALYNFVVSVDKIEEMTGIDFFPKLADSQEDLLEKSNDYKSWSF